MFGHAQPMSRTTVLLVEDDPLIQAMAADALEGSGFDVVAVSAAEDALGLMAMDVRFDAVCTDIQLAGPLDGWDVAEAAREFRPGIPVVYASGSADAAISPRRVEGSDWVAKPYSPLALGLALRNRLAPAGHTPDIAPAAPPTAEASNVVQFPRRKIA